MSNESGMDNTLQFIHAMKYYSIAMKMNELKLHRTKQETQNAVAIEKRELL